MSSDGLQAAEGVELSAAAFQRTGLVAARTGVDRCLLLVESVGCSDGVAPASGAMLTQRRLYVILEPTAGEPSSASSRGRKVVMAAGLMPESQRMA